MAFPVGPFQNRQAPTTEPHPNPADGHPATAPTAPLVGEQTPFWHRQKTRGKDSFFIAIDQRRESQVGAALEWEYVLFGGNHDQSINK
jgi:hypothetical protein